MDPNAALDEINILIAKRDAFRQGEEVFWQHDEYRLEELTTGLFEWLNKGGILPYAWQH